MARWKLMEPHYLSVPGTEWEYRETNRETGRSARKVYDVPLYLDPKDPTYWTDKAEELIIVTDKFDPAHPRDIVFTGPPTPNMEALDDEAIAISDAERKNWINPIESLNMTYSESRLSEFEREIASIVAGQAKERKASNLSLGGVSAEEFERLQQQVAMLMEQNTKLQGQLAAQPKVARRA